MIIVLTLFICSIGCALGIAFFVVAGLLGKSNSYGSETEVDPCIRKLSVENAEQIHKI